MAFFEKVGQVATETYEKVSEWYHENEYEVWDTCGWLIGCAIGGYISTKLGLGVGYLNGYGTGFRDGQANATEVIKAFSSKV